MMCGRGFLCNVCDICNICGCAAWIYVIYVDDGDVIYVIYVEDRNVIYVIYVIYVAQAERVAQAGELARSYDRKLLGETQRLIAQRASSHAHTTGDD
jgi:hypothetical protein